MGMVCGSVIPAAIGKPWQAQLQGWLHQEQKGPREVYS